MNQTAKNVGIIDLEVYWPKLYVKQEELEEWDQCPGKYIHGLGQKELAVCSFQEDAVSMALTVAHRLIQRLSLDKTKIGRIDVGTESSFDLSKSIKSHIMQLFDECANYSIEGADNVNACYGGTAALFNCCNWMESSSWNGGYALVITTDMAIYSEHHPAARATGGAAAVCMLIGPDAPIIVESSRGHHMTNCYDFYKPISEKYPCFEAKLSLIAYLTCLLGASYDYCEKIIGKVTNFNLFAENNFFCFHSPYTKLPMKGYCYLRSMCDEVAQNKQVLTTIKRITDLIYSDVATDKTNFEKKITGQFSADCERQLHPSLVIPGRIGNSYCSSLYVSFFSLLGNVELDRLKTSRVIMYSYGSGSLSSMFSLTFNPEKYQELNKVCQNVKNKITELEFRAPISPQTMIFLKNFDYKNMEDAERKINTTESYISPDVYYIESIDESHRRSYARFEPTG